jgi:hypothetical protein
MITKNCPMCSAEYQTYPSRDKKYCSLDCMLAHKKDEAYKKYKCECKNCGREFMPPRPKEGGIYCSYLCRGVDSRKDRIDRNGYWYVSNPTHPGANRQGHVPEHHLVVEQETGALIQNGFVVHHIDEDKKNNDIDNLQVMTKSEHRALHMRLAHERGLVNTSRQRVASSERMKRDNPCVNCERGSDGRYKQKLQ